MLHSFDVEFAEVYGVRSALVYDFLKNECKRSKLIINNKKWLRLSMNTLKEIFPYMTEYAIARAIDTLYNNSLIKIENFNQSEYDMTRWYSVCGA